MGGGFGAGEVMSRFIGYHIDDSHAHGQPVSTGATRQQALGRAATRVLGLGISSGSIQALTPNEPLTEDEFAHLTAMLDGWFAERGIQ